MAEAAGLLCGVDIGTTHIKAVLVTGDGEVVSVATTTTPVTSDGHGACHDPEEIRAAVQQVMRRAQDAVPDREPIAAIGVTSVGEEGVPLDTHGHPLYPSIAWYERRPSAAERDWSARHDDDELFAVTGLHKDLGFTLFKWLWLKSEQPSVWSACAWWLGIADYVVWRWTGERGMSVSHASRTAVFDLAAFRWQQDWAAEALARGVDALPPLRQAGDTVGVLRRGQVDGLVTAPEVPVVATGLDHVVGGYAAGVLRPGQILDSMGTAEALVEPVPARRLTEADPAIGIDFSAGILPGTHVALAGLSSGAGVGGMLRTLGAVSASLRQELERAAARVPPGADGLRYIPPRMRGGRPGGLFGHTVDHRAEHLYRAVVEGWTLAAADALAAMGGQDRPVDVVCIGGGSQSPLWTRVKASVLDGRVRCVQTPELVAVGAALLAGQAVSGHAVSNCPRPAGRAVSAAHRPPATGPVPPVPEWVARYQELRAEFAALARLVHPDAGRHVYP